MHIRLARISDAAALLKIYRPYITDTAVSFELTVPTVSEFADRIAEVLADYPYLVAENDDGQILGFVYAHRYRPRAAYDWTVETSIYTDKAARGKGVGRQLYQALETELATQHVTSLLACVTGENLASLAYHQHLGYELVGTFKQVGFKHGKGYDTYWLQKQLSAATGEAFIPYSQLPHSA